MKKKETEPVLMPDDPQEDLIRRLLKLSGGRPAVSEEITNRVRGSVYNHWQHVLRTRKRRRLILILSGSIAACLLLFLLSWYFGIPFSNPTPVAVVENQTGPILRGKEELLSRGTIIFAGSTLESGDSSRALLRTVKGATLRLDVQTRLRFETVSTFVLEKGAVYLDSGKTHDRFLVSTPLGSIANHGTQFEIRLREKGMEVRVREGSVSLTNQKLSQTVTAGNRLSIDGNGKIRMSEFVIYGPEWDWISRVSPGFHLEGRTLTEFLAWIAHENGWRLNLTDAQIQQSQGKIVLHGSVENLSPAQMLEAVLPVCGFTYGLDKGVLTVNSAGKR